MSSERDRRDAKINLSARRARPEDSNTLTRRGREGGGSLGRGRVPAPFPVLPSPGRHVGRAEAPGRVGAPGLWPRVGCTSVSGGPGTPRPRVPASPRGVFAQNRSVRLPGPPRTLPLGQVWPGVSPFRRREHRGRAATLRPATTSAGVSLGHVVCSDWWW